MLLLLLGGRRGDGLSLPEIGELNLAGIEGEFTLRPREVIVFNGWSLQSEREFGQRASGKKAYTGPALAVEWIEIEGPLGDWPPAGYRSLFDGIPLEPQIVHTHIVTTT